jgi:transposase
VDESGQSLTPVVRRTWAPRGRTPVLRHRFRRWQRISMVGLCCYGPDRSRARLAFHTQPDAYTTQALIGVIGELRRFLAGAKVTLLWDNLPAHRSQQMQQFLATQRSWLVVERLPAYAPELNPVEGLWANLKAVELANLVVDTLQDVVRAARQGVTRIRRKRKLLWSFLDHTGLSL